MPQTPEEKCYQATRKEIKKMIRQCWSPGCKGFAFLRDWAGWKWCFRHWIWHLKGKENQKWLYIKTTKIF